MTRRTRIKICGLTTPAAATAAVDAGADAVGLVFASGSPRCIDAKTAAAIRSSIPIFVRTVCVYRDAPIEDIAATRGPADLLQLHGDEDDAYLRRLGEPVIRGFAYEPDALRRWDECPGVAALLVDGVTPGGGAAFDHDAITPRASTLSKPLILAGGLTPENVGVAVQRVRPFAVDVSSGVESSPGVKDPGRIAAFCDAVRRADAAAANAIAER
ncbi:MAG: phosphoribosylanthranilate isomerase [Phycisphaerales bacterium]|nr:phosphoribosylanthranilate isomerase [Phycisphaerae bacterium]NNF43584.1 phosphoribosylanthranilate isomerase [Phycisphaerales bacterium]NNM24496.1 phosphoribosylanthranilate isomerase [Phycisphaerales bacterium]